MGAGEALATALIATWGPFYTGLCSLNTGSGYLPTRYPWQRSWFACPSLPKFLRKRHTGRALNRKLK
jgi:hypothetical protein